MLVDSLSWLHCLGLHDDNDPEESGYQYKKSIFDTDENTVCSIHSDQNVNNFFEINGIKYCLSGLFFVHVYCRPRKNKSIYNKRMGTKQN